jgi:hypothetical protein
MPDLYELQVDGLIAAPGQVQRRLLRELLYLPPAQAPQRQQAQQRRSSLAGREKIPLPEPSRPRRKINLTIAQVPVVLQKQSFKVHLGRKNLSIQCPGFAMP